MGFKRFIFVIIIILTFILISSSTYSNNIGNKYITELPSLKEIINYKLDIVVKENKIKKLEKIIKEKEKIINSINNFDIEKGKKVKLIVTAYAPYDNKSGICADSNPNITATGTKPRMGVIAVNPKRFSYGTRFYIKGYGYGIAEDTGSAMRKNPNKIDVFVKTYDDAMKWGKKEIEVIVFEN